MTTEFRPQTIAVLRAIKEHGPITLRELEDALFYGAAKATLVNLQTHRYIESTRNVSSAPSRYVITAKGNRTLAAMGSSQGEVAGPRQPISSDPYRGEVKGYIDPARLEFLSKPSRVGDECFEWRRPMINGATA